MEAETVADLFTRDRRTDRPALVDATGREYDYHWLCTTAWKAGNFLRHTGVRRGVTVGVVGEGPLALLAFFGTALLEGTTRFDPPRDCSTDDSFRTLVAPTDDLGEYDLPAGAQLVGYDGRPDDPGVHHFDAGLWSENPSFPPLSIDPGTQLLTDGADAYTHGSVVDAARAIAADVGIAEGTRVVVREPLTDVRVVAAGVIAPLVVGGTVVLVDGETSGGDGARGDVAVGATVDGAPEPTVLDPGDVPHR